MYCFGSRMPIWKKGSFDRLFCCAGFRVNTMIGRLAAVEGEILLGAIGKIAPERLERIKGRLAEWLTRS